MRIRILPTLFLLCAISGCSFLESFYKHPAGGGPSAAEVAQSVVGGIPLWGQIASAVIGGGALIFGTHKTVKHIKRKREAKKATILP